MDSLDRLPSGMSATDPELAGEAEVELICGAYRLGHGRAPRSLTALPDVMAVTPDPARHPELRSLVEILRAPSAFRLETRSTRT